MESNWTWGAFTPACIWFGSVALDFVSPSAQLMYTAMNVEMGLASSGSNRDSGAGDLLEVLASSQTMELFARGRNVIRAPSGQTARGLLGVYAAC